MLQICSNLYLFGIYNLVHFFTVSLFVTFYRIKIKNKKENTERCKVSLRIQSECGKMRVQIRTLFTQCFDCRLTSIKKQIFQSFTEILLNTVQPVYSGHAIQWTLFNRGLFLVEPAESRSNSHRKAPIQKTRLQRTIAISQLIL